jgi:hypothetical protein
LILKYLGDAQPLSKYEAKLFRKDPKIKERIVKSYRLMYFFYQLIIMKGLIFME